MEKSPIFLFPMAEIKRNDLCIFFSWGCCCHQEERKNGDFSILSEKNGEISIIFFQCQKSKKRNDLCIFFSWGVVVTKKNERMEISPFFSGEISIILFPLSEIKKGMIYVYFFSWWCGCHQEERKNGDFSIILRKHPLFSRKNGESSITVETMSQIQK